MRSSVQCRDVNKYKDKDKDLSLQGQGPNEDLSSRTEIKDFRLAGIHHATNTNHLRGQVWWGFCASVLFSSCVALVGVNIITTMWFENPVYMAVTDSKGAQNFFQKAAFLCVKGSLFCALAINEDRADKLSSTSVLFHFFDPPLVGLYTWYV